jgi:predicted nucleic acid-binding protein
MSVLVDTNILIDHLAGSPKAAKFLTELIARQAFNISILTKIEFLGWDKHTPEGFEKSRRLVELSQIYPLSQEVADTAIDLRRKRMIKLADAVIAATAIVNNLQLATRNIDSLRIINPFE